MSERLYHVTYSATAHPEGIPRSEVTDGACDHLILHSICGTPLGAEPLSVAVVSLNGKTGGALTPEQVFVCWVMLAKGLAETLAPGNARDFCADVHDAVRSVVDSNKMSADAFSEDT